LLFEPLFTQWVVEQAIVKTDFPELVYVYSIAGNTAYWRTVSPKYPMMELYSVFKHRKYPVFDFEAAVNNYRRLECAGLVQKAGVDAATFNAWVNCTAETIKLSH
jgi:hypothetical protein